MLVKKDDLASIGWEVTSRTLILRYAGRNRVEDSLDISVNFFHLNCLASEVRLNANLGRDKIVNHFPSAESGVTCLTLYTGSVH